MHMVLLIVNKHGSLSYTRNFQKNSNFTDNDYILLGSTFHSMHAISSQITPECQKSKEQEITNSNLLDGITDLVCDSFHCKCLQTQTGVKIVLFSDHNGAKYQDDLLRRTNQCYADFVSKNPFQPPEMPIKSALFDQQIHALFSQQPVM